MRSVVLLLLVGGLITTIPRTSLASFEHLATKSRLIHTANTPNITAPNNDAGISGDQNHQDRRREDVTASTLFEELDINKDGYIDQSEAGRSRLLRLDQMDLDHDRTISRNEWIEYQTKKRR